MTIIIWKCKKCESVQVSNSKIRHQMDSCKCGGMALDLEEGYSRILFKDSPEDLIKLKTIKDNKMHIWTELLLCATEQEFIEKIGDNMHYVSMYGILDELREIEKEVYLSLVI